MSIRVTLHGTLSANHLVARKNTFSEVERSCKYPSLLHRSKRLSLTILLVLRVSSRKMLLRLLDTVNVICQALPVRPFLEFKRMVEHSLAAIGEQLLPSAMLLAVEDKRY